MVVEGKRWKWHEIKEYIDKLSKEKLKSLDINYFNDLSYGQIILLKEYINHRLNNMR